MNKTITNKYKRRTKRMLNTIAKECLLALLVTVFLTLSTSFYENAKQHSQVNEKLNSIYLTVSDEYVETLFGVPRVSVKENDELTNNFYIVDDVVLRTVSNENIVVAYFITSLDSNRKTPTQDHSSDDIFIGEVTFEDINHPNPIIDTSYSMDPTIIYYSESQGTGRYGQYNHYIYGCASYGFVNEDTYDFITSINCEKELSYEESQRLRNKVKPNTFGVVLEEYSNIISINPKSDGWVSTYHIINQ